MNDGASNTVMPVFFIGHGSPMNAIEDNQFSKVWQSLSGSFPKPKAILCISAHWVTKETSITSNENPPTIHDFGGFPKELFEVLYPAPGNVNLATEIATELKEFNCITDASWGLDHGTWSIVRHIFPNADIPVLQLSIKGTIDGNYHYQLGKKLIQFRKQGILIIGSGNLIHNLGLVDWSKVNQPEFGYDWAIEANQMFKEWVLTNNISNLIEYKKHGIQIQNSIPTAEHYLPFLYVLGAKQDDDQIQIFNDKVVMGSLNMTSFRFG